MTEVKKVLMVIANDGFQDHEFGISFAVFHDAGLDITIAAGEKGECRGVFGARTIADVDLFFADATKYDMVVFIGGGGAYAQYFHDQTYLKLAKMQKRFEQYVSLLGSSVKVEFLIERLSHHETKIEYNKHLLKSIDDFGMSDQL